MKHICLGDIKVLIPLFRSFIFTLVKLSIIISTSWFVLIPLFRSFIFTLNAEERRMYYDYKVLIPLFRSFIFTLPFRFLYYIYNSNKCFAKVLLNLLIFL